MAVPGRLRLTHDDCAAFAGEILEPGEVLSSELPPGLSLEVAGPLRR